MLRRLKIKFGNRSCKEQKSHLKIKCKIIELKPKNINYV